MKEAVSTLSAPAAIGPYSQAIRAGSLVFVSGQIPIDPATGELEGEEVCAQAERVMRNLGAVLAAAGCAFSDVVRTTVYLLDLKDFAAVNAIYGARFRPPYPTRATVQVAALPRAALIEIDAIAIVPAPP